MAHIEYVAQSPGGVRSYLDLFDSALDHGQYKQLTAAVAYAWISGVELLEQRLSNKLHNAWVPLEKRWLISIDRMASQPSALERLAGLPTSQLRIHDGNRLIHRPRCMPSISFHPKLFVFSGDSSVAIIHGSGNLSRSGLSNGYEIGSLLVVSHEPQDELFRLESETIYGWIEERWSTGTAGDDDFLRVYRDLFDSIDNAISPQLSEDDVTDEVTAHAETSQLGPLDLVKLRRSENLWIDAGILTQATGQNNQLQMKRMTRVFFGANAVDVPRDTLVLDGIIFKYGNSLKPDSTVRYSNNGMDVLGLPTNQEGGPVSYDNQVLHFNKLNDGAFRLTLVDDTQRQHMAALSKEKGSFFRFQGSTRRFGAY